MSRRPTSQDRANRAAWFVLRRIPGGAPRAATALYDGVKIEWRGEKELPYFYGGPLLGFAQRSWFSRGMAYCLTLERALARYRQRCLKKTNPSAALLWGNQ